MGLAVRSDGATQRGTAKTIALALNPLRRPPRTVRSSMVLFWLSAILSSNRNVSPPERGIPAKSFLARRGAWLVSLCEKKKRGARRLNYESQSCRGESIAGSLSERVSWKLGSPSAQK